MTEHVQVRGQEGELVEDDQGVSLRWQEAPGVMVWVSGGIYDGVTRAEVETFAASLREATAGEWDALVDEFGE